VAQSIESNTNQLKKYVLMALFAGTTVGLGYLLISIPNVEAVTLMLFISGYTLGMVNGIMVAVVASTIYFGFNPQGGMYPPLLIAQIIGMSLAPALGFLLKSLKSNLNRWKIASLLGLSAIICTAFYDLLTNIAYPLSTGMGVKGIIGFIIAGIPFSALHILSNTLIFLFVIPKVTQYLDNHPLIV
jgi:hypothetical protein